MKNAVVGVGRPQKDHSISGLVIGISLLCLMALVVAY